jgi:hypothetical protein
LPLAIAKVIVVSLIQCQHLRIQIWQIFQVLNKSSDFNTCHFAHTGASHLFEFDSTHNPVAFPSPRTWEFTHRALQKFDDNLNLFRAAASACVGEVAHPN